jgi:hypothetical protein
VSRRASPVVEWRQLVLASELGWTARLVALTLSTHMDRNGGSCFPSLTTLERETRLSRRGICYALDELEQAGLLDRKRARGKPTRYRATSAHRALALVHTVHPTSAHGAPEDVQESVHTSPGRAHARRKKEGARAAGARPDKIDPDLLAYDR